MTCGACHPEAFHSNTGGRVFGYLVGRDPTGIADDTRKLMYLGAQYVYADLPEGNVRFRKGLARLRKVMRPGDKMVLARLNALGQRRHRAEAVLSEIEADGIETAVVWHDYFES